MTRNKELIQEIDRLKTIIQYWYNTNLYLNVPPELKDYRRLIIQQYEKKQYKNIYFEFLDNLTSMEVKFYSFRVKINRQLTHRNEFILKSIIDDLFDFISEKLNIMNDDKYRKMYKKL